MSPIIHFILSTTLLFNCKCSYRIRNANDEADELQDNLEMFVRPIKKLTGIFPNHEIEVQFDIEGNYETTKQRRRANKKFPSQQIIRTDNISAPIALSESSSIQTSSSPADPDNQIVYMKDLKKALDDYEKKHSTMNDPATSECNQLPPSNELALPTLGNANGLKLLDIINVLKKSSQIHKDVQKPNDEELSWLKIQVPA